MRRYNILLIAASVIFVLFCACSDDDSTSQQYDLENLTGFYRLESYEIDSLVVRYDVSEWQSDGKSCKLEYRGDNTCKIDYWTGLVLKTGKRENWFEIDGDEIRVKDPSSFNFVFSDNGKLKILYLDSNYFVVGSNSGGMETRYRFCKVDPQSLYPAPQLDE